MDTEQTNQEVKPKKMTANAVIKHFNITADELYDLLNEIYEELELLDKNKQVIEI